jgi:hypothetical protein
MMQLRLPITVPAVLVVAGLLGQTAMVRPAPAWRLGDKRVVESRGAMELRMDTMTIRSSFESSYVVEVTRARKDGYRLTVRSGTFTQSGLGWSGVGPALVDSVNNLYRGIVEAASEPFSRLAFTYQVDRSGRVLGRLEEEGDKDAMKQATEQAINKITAALAGLPGGSTKEIPSGVISHLVDSLYSAYLEVQVNEMNYFLKIYGTEFPLTGSLRQPVMVEDVQSPIHAEYGRLPAMLEAGLDKNDDRELVGRTITTYDPDALFQAMQAMNPVDASMREGLYFIEECVERLDKRTGWLTSSTTAQRMRMGPIKMNLVTTTTLTVVR